MLFGCSALRAGRGIGTPLAERERYTGTVLHSGVQIVQNEDGQLKMES